MLNPIYKSIKGRIQTPDEPAEAIALPVEWYNVQYEETMINDEGFFVEFPEKLNIDAISKDARRTDLTVRVHVYSKALRTSDGIADTVVESHESTANALKELLEGFTPEGCSKPLKLSGWQHWHRWKGWMVTFVEFSTKKIL